MNLNKRNLVLQAAVASALLTAVGAQAGITGPVAPVASATFASEIFGTGSSATVLLNAGGGMNVVYTLGVTRTIAASTFQATIALTGGAQFATAAAAGSLVGGGGVCVAAITVRSGGAVADTQVVYDLTPSGTCTIGDTLTFTMPALKNAQSLATAATKIGVTVNLSDLFGALDTSGTHATSIAVSAASLTVTGTAVAALTTAPDNFTIDAISQTSMYFVNGAAGATGSKLARLGTITYGDVATSLQKDGATARSRVVGDAINLTVTGNFGASLAVASSGGVYLSASATCATVDKKYTSLTATTATFTALPGTNANTSLCMAVDGTTAIVPSAYTATSVYVPLITTEASTTTAFSMATTALNAKTADVRQYLPAAASTGITQFIRIINNGAVAAKITAIVIDDTTGVAAGEVQLIASLAKGASATLSSTQVEAALTAGGVTIASTARPRIRIVAATDSLEVQAFQFFADGTGNFTAMMGKE